MSDIETRSLEQLPAATAVSPNALTAIQEPGGPVQKLEIRQLLGRLISTNEATETEDELQALLDYDANSIGLVFADPDPALNGWYRKTGASGAGTWVLFEKLSATAAAEVQALVDAAEAARDESEAAAAAIGDNLGPDPFFSQTARPTDSVLLANRFGTYVDKDPASPFGGGSVSNTVLIRHFERLSSLPFRIGDQINCRIFGTFTSVVSFSLEFFNDGFVQVGASASAAAAVAITAGTKAAQVTITIPANAVYVRINISGLSGNAVSLFARAFAFAPITPYFAPAPVQEDRRKVYAEAAQRLSVAFGDSITADAIDVTTTPHTTMDSLISKQLGGIVMNFAFGGTTLAPRAAADYSAFSVSKLWRAIRTADWSAQDAALATRPEFAAKLAALKLVDWSKVYDVTVAHGTNDYGTDNGKVIGTNSDTTDATFKGALNLAIEDMLEINSNLRMCFITPIYRDRFEAKGFGTGRISGGVLIVETWNPSVGNIAVGDSLYMAGVVRRTKVVPGGTGTGGIGTYNLDSALWGTLTTRNIALADASRNSDVHLNGQGALLGDYAQAIREVCALNHIPVADAFSEFRLNRHTATRLTQDGVHLSPLIGMYDYAAWRGQRVAQVLV